MRVSVLVHEQHTLNRLPHAVLGVVSLADSGRYKSAQQQTGYWKLPRTASQAWR